MLDEFEKEELKAWLSNPVTKAVIAQVGLRKNYLNEEGWKQETTEKLWEAKGRFMEAQNLLIFITSLGKEE